MVFPPQRRAFRTHHDGVECGSQGRVRCGKFQERASADPTQIDIIVKEDGTGVGRRNPPSLQAGFRKDQRLRFNGNIQLLQDRPEISEFGVVAQLHFSGRQIIP